jgi:hypothetical protein
MANGLSQLEIKLTNTQYLKYGKHFPENPNRPTNRQRLLVHDARPHQAWVPPQATVMMEMDSATATGREEATMAG